MRKLIVLLRKDITLDKANLAIVILLSIGIPIYISYTFQNIGLQKGADFVSLLLSSFYCCFMFLSKLGLIEHKYRGTAYLILTPINRRDVVLSKYVLILLLFLISLAGYGVSYVVTPFLQPLSFTAVVIVWTANILFLSFYVPLEFKLGYENVKYFFLALVVISPFLIGLIGKYGGISIFQRFMEEVGTILPIMLVFSFILIAVSYYVSIQIFNRKDL
jgi:hypothetical protein